MEKVRSSREFHNCSFHCLVKVNSCRYTTICKTPKPSTVQAVLGSPFPSLYFRKGPGNEVVRKAYKKCQNRINLKGKIRLDGLLRCC